MYTINELIQHLQSIGQVVAPDKVEVKVQTPTGAVYTVDEVGFNAIAGVVTIRGTRKTAKAARRG